MKHLVIQTKLFRIFGNQFLADQSSVVDQLADMPQSAVQTSEQLDARVMAYELSNIQFEMKVKLVVHTYFSSWIHFFESKFVV